MSESQAVESDAEDSAEILASPDFRIMDGKRRWACVVALVVLCLTSAFLLRDWIKVALSEDLHSHILLIPLVSIYLLVDGKKHLVWNSAPSWIIGTTLMLLAGIIAAWVAFIHPAWSMVDLVALKMGAWLCAVWGICFLCLGGRWVWSARFSVAFLLFLIPLPDVAVDHLEGFLMTASAQLAESVFQLGGVPVFRHGQVLELPGTVLEVAQACSGIRSTWVLLITSILAAYLFLPPNARSLILVAAVLPLGILRNAVRIYVIGWLCVHYGPQMIDHWIHHKGGPVFFAASLLPLFLLAWWLRARGPCGAESK